MTPLRIGSVPYLNARPLVAGLADDPDVRYREEVPSRLAERLADGALDAALVSSIEALRPGAAPLIENVCIGSDGPVLSVLLVGRDDPRRAATVALDGASLTAATLTRVVYHHFLERRDVSFVRADVAPDPARTGADATLVIGDAALRLLEEGRTGARVLDLGAAWTEATGLPFLWAGWLTSPGADLGRLRRRLDRAWEDGRPRRGEDARRGARELGLSSGLAERYLLEVMRYPFGARERAGLVRFGELARTIPDSPIAG
ncbi:MAG: menaquinone biosynthetic enzyme MqnA/MqnD family protein [Planctomycetota bacterium JB042]